MDDPKEFKDFLLERYGKDISIEGVVSQTLNTYSIRGFASIDKLSVISSADVNDDAKNPEGTQRPLKMPRVKAAWNYAQGIDQEGKDLGIKRVFTDALFNIRDENIVEISIGDEVIDGSQKSLENNLGKNACIKIMVDEIHEQNFQQIPEPSETEIQLSRVDGNHRLEGPMIHIRESYENGEELNINFPPIGFTLFSGINVTDEDIIFEKVNGENTPVDTSLLAKKQVAREGKDLLYSDQMLDVAKYLATQLNKEGAPFEGLINQGGLQAAAEEQQDRKLPHKLRPFAGYIKVQLDTAGLFRDDMPDESHREDWETTIVRLWSMVRKTWPECFDDAGGRPGEYILFQAAGMNAMAYLLGKLMNELTTDNPPSQDDIQNRLKQLKESVSFHRKDANGEPNPEYDGKTGLGGGKRIAEYWKENMPSQGDTTVNVRNFLD
jgi:hypothetical protein